MAAITVTITIDESTGLNGRDIGRFIERCTSYVKNPALEITATPTTIDIRHEKTFSDIEITGPMYQALKKEAKRRGVSIEKLLEAGAKRYGL